MCRSQANCYAGVEQTILQGPALKVGLPNKEISYISVTIVKTRLSMHWDFSDIDELHIEWLQQKSWLSFRSGRSYKSSNNSTIKRLPQQVPLLLGRSQAQTFCCIDVQAAPKTRED